MDRLTLSRNLAQSLTLGAWSSERIGTRLLKRLPSALHRLVPSIAGSLYEALPAQYAPSAKVVAKALLQIDDFERVFRYCQRRIVWPLPDLTPPEMAPVSSLVNVEVPQLATVESLSEWLLLPPNRLDYFADVHSRHEHDGELSINHYHYVLKKKKLRGSRVIEAPKSNLKAIQRQILRGIVEKLPSHSDAFGFTKGRSCLQAAGRHAAEQVVVCFDLKSFFPTIGAGRIYGLFRCLGYPHLVARYLTAICTTSTPHRILDRLPYEDRLLYRNPHLPQGSPVSPALANHVAFALDRRLSALARSLDVNYSRYADDLSFSGDKRIVGCLMTVVPQIIGEEGFVVNQAKTRVMSQTSRQIVTGVVVNEHLNIDRREFDRLKAVIHACGNANDSRLSDPHFRASLLGKIGWVETVNPNRGAKLRRLLEVAWTKVNLS